MNQVTHSPNFRTPAQTFRRPASLSLQQQAAIEGGLDPAIKLQMAQESAAALLHGVRQSVDPAVRQRVINLVRTEGLEDLAALWSEAEAISLPGALWRLYLLHTWVDRDPANVKERVELGKSTVPGLAYLAGFPEPPTIDDMKETLDEILAGAFTGDLGMALRRAAAVSMLAAFGTVQLTVQPDGSATASKHFLSADAALHQTDPVTVIAALEQQQTDAAGRLLKLGESLEAAAVLAEQNQLH